MRTRIIFFLKNRGGHAPFHHQYMLARVIKGILMKGGDQEFIKYPYYNFSGIKGQTKVSRDGLHYYSSRVTLVFSSPNKAFIDYFLHNLFAFDTIEVGGLQLKPDAVELENPAPLLGKQKFICISPLVLLNSSFNDNTAKRFIVPEAETFSDLLYDSTIERMEQSGVYDEEQLASFDKFEMVPDQDYIARLSASQKKYARIYPVFDQDVKYEVRGYTFPFTLEAAKEVHQFVFNCGLGYFTHKGFGMLDIANSNPNNRTVKYVLDSP